MALAALELNVLATQLREIIVIFALLASSEAAGHLVVIREVLAEPTPETVAATAAHAAYLMLPEEVVQAGILAPVVKVDSHAEEVLSAMDLMALAEPVAEAAPVLAIKLDARGGKFRLPVAVVVV